ncbi:drug/metabolite transporter (DMT)-like permease [Silvibacterium bohemicum]|uniref:Drug/metabolite transporter (DMT)-like permease n=1 Tax=Silvibacterium bohemicum TaxID=1577686 RepID=A0A841JVX1_9BACT|nr:DMT family transporter [Silvibacterium bohemicum]MBB6144607.1 drug/metabolite transporter (DMT)-like permease [Silvibacterium bohemicum]
MNTQIQTRSSRSTTALGYGACALAGTLWGTGFYFGKIALTQMSVGHMVVYRFFFAMLGLLPALLVRPRRPGLNRKEWGLLLLASFLGIPVQFLIQFYGLSLTTVSHAALMVGTAPVILAIGATIFTHERLDWKGWMALFGSTCGVVLITLSGGHGLAANGPSLVGDMLVVLSVVISLGWILLNRHLMHGHSAMVVTAYGILSGLIMLVLCVVPIDGWPPVHGVSGRVWFALVASGLFCTAATTFLWNWGIHHVPASRAGVFLNIEPALGSILGVELLGDRLGPGAWVGGGLIIAAAVVLTATGRIEAEVILE